MMCLEVDLFPSILFGLLWASWTSMSASFIKLGRFSFSIFSNRFLMSCSFSSSSGIPKMRCWYAWHWPRGSLHYPHFFWILFSSCSDWLFFVSLCSKSFIWFLASSTLLLFPCQLFFISVSVSFVSEWMFFMLLRSSPVSYTHLTLPTTGSLCRSRWSPYH